MLQQNQATTTTVARKPGAFFNSGGAGGAFFSPTLGGFAPTLKNVVQREEAALGGLINPYTNPLDVEQGALLLERVLAPHRRSDAMGFLRAIRNLTTDEAIFLLEEVAFWREIRQTHQGAALWSIFTILYFSNRLDTAQRRLSMAIGLGNIGDAIDALAIIIADNNGSGTLSEQYWETLIDVIFGQFGNHPFLIDLYRMILLRDSEWSRPRNVGFQAKEVHYETNTSGSYELRQFSWSPGMSVATTLHEFRVVIRIGLNLQGGGSFFDERMRSIPDRWERAIERVWNNQFIVSNGERALNFVVSPVFVFDGSASDKQVQVMPSEELKCPNVPQAGRANAGCWFADGDDNTVAHEFGHLLGARDEYRIPGSAAEMTPQQIGSMSATDTALSTRDGIAQAMNPSATPRTPSAARTDGYSDLPSLMNDHDDSQQVYIHHLTSLLAAFNAALPPGTPPYRVTRR